MMILKLSKKAAKALCGALCAESGVTELKAMRWEFSDALVEKMRGLTWKRLLYQRGVGEFTAMEVVVTLRQQGIEIAEVPEDARLPLRMRTPW